MHYENVDQKITAKWQVALDGWPLTKFSSLSSIVTRNEVEILYNAFKTGTAKFPCFPDAKREKWDAAYFQAPLNMTLAQEMMVCLLEAENLYFDCKLECPAFPSSLIQFLPVSLSRILPI